MSDTPPTTEPATEQAEQATPRRSKRPIVRKPCHCGCDTETASKFAPGHDARWASAVVTAWSMGERTRENAIEAATEISEAMGRKVRHMIEVREAKRAKAAGSQKGDAQPEAAPAEAPAKPEPAAKAQATAPKAKAK